MKYTYQEREYIFERYPTTTNRSLRPLSAADELLLEFYQDTPEQTLLIQHDRFGALACCLHQAKPVVVGTFASQEIALKLNREANQVPESDCKVVSPLDQPELPVDLTLMRLPKSLGLFELYLAQAVRSSKPGAKIVVSFMTRHFTPAILEIAKKYAAEVSQSKAKKKARLLILEGVGLQSSSEVISTPEDLLKTISYSGNDFQQYYGVFSANHIDYATQYLLPFVTPSETEIEAETPIQLLDIGCGNGIIGHRLCQYYPNGKLTVTEDSSLAISSARLNLDEAKTTFLYTDTLDQLATDSQDLIVTNPPFHFGHENNIEVSISLFKQVQRVLKPGGKFYLVANRHLNYRTHLEPLFGKVFTKGESERFVVYEAAL